MRYVLKSLIRGSNVESINSIHIRPNSLSTPTSPKSIMALSILMVCKINIFLN